MEDLKEIQTLIHPLNKEFVQSTANKKLHVKNKPENQVRVLTYNLQLIPPVVLNFSEAYPSSS